jgi:hypothetical protein
MKNYIYALGLTASTLGANAMAAGDLTDVSTAVSTGFSGATPAVLAVGVAVIGILVVIKGISFIKRAL